MAQVLIRNLPEKVVEALRLRAILHGRSLEAELRLLLTHEASLGPSRAAEAPVPYGAAAEAQPAVARKRGKEDWPPNIPGVIWPKTRPKFKRYKPLPQTGKPASEILIEDRNRR